MQLDAHACNLTINANSTSLTISRTEGIAMKIAKTPASLRLAMMLALSFAVPGLGNNTLRADDKPPNKEFSSRLSSVSEACNQYLTELVKIYKDIHSHPELSLQELRTSNKLAELMK